MVVVIVVVVVAGDDVSQMRVGFVEGGDGGGRDGACCS